MANKAAGLRTIALLEFGKGLLVLLTALAVFRFIHADWQAWADHIVSHFHLNPARRYPKILLALAHHMTEPRLLALACGALFYVALRWVEAYGLWKGRAWAAILGIVSAAMYLPFEVIDLAFRFSWVSALLFAINLIIVLTLWRGQNRLPR